MSEISLILVLQNKNKQNSEWHGKNTNKIQEAHSFWGDFFYYGAIWIACHQQDQDLCFQVHLCSCKMD